WSGLLVAGACFIIPATLLVGAIAWGYLRFGRLPQVSGVMDGIKAVIIAVVLQALWALARTAVKTRRLRAVTLGAVAGTVLGVHERFVRGGAGVFMLIAGALRTRTSKAATALVPPVIPILGAAMATTAAPFSLGGLFFIFLKVGSVLFGS